LFAIVRNEMYFLPHLLSHYRALGIEEFVFLDDRSDDGSFEFLMAQHDCTVLTANVSFGDRVGPQNRRFGTAVRTIVPRQLLRHRWVLTVDADEFMVLPPGFETVQQLAGALERNGLPSARALMLDFFPATLAELEAVPRGTGPFDACPFFDAYTSVDWPGGTNDPKRAYLTESVRPRMLAELQRRGTPLGNLLDDYGHASLHKVPLLFWGDETRVNTTHHADRPPTDRIQLALAHFKFYPGYAARIADALASKAHWLNSSEYRFLDIAMRELQGWPLQGPRSRRYEGPQQLVEAGLLYSRLD
jgi:hypothetical protein